MKFKKSNSRTKQRREAGQVMLLTVLALSVFMIGAIAFAIDMSNMWFNRQTAQTAADAACTSAAMDMLVGDTNGTMPASANFTASSSNTYDCGNISGGTPAPCSYAALNGYNSGLTQTQATSGTIGNNVYIDFPSASSYVCQDGTNCLKNLNLPTSVPFATLVRVQITSNIPTWFAGMLKGMTKQSTGATAICGVLQATSPIPILVMHPTMSGSLHMNGGGSSSSTGCKNPLCGDIVIAGGPSKSIQVNSSDPNAIVFKGGPQINLCPGGNNYCGSALGTWGGPSSGGGNFWTGSTCSISTVNNLCKSTQQPPQWDLSPPLADPLASYAAPGQPNFANSTYPPSGTAAYQGVPAIAYGSQGCPDPLGCHLFSPGYFPNGIDVKGFTGIFDPGIYYIGGDAKASKVCSNGSSNGSFCEESGSCIRPSTNKGDGSGGTIFYFADSNSVMVGGGGGDCKGVDTFDTAAGALGLGVSCTGASKFPKDLPSTLSGSVLMAPCNAPDPTTSKCTPNCSVNYGDPLGTTDPFGEQRGILFFQDRATSSGASPTWSGNGGMLLAGDMYFHQCIIGGSDTGQNCDFTTPAFNDVLSLGGTSGSNTYVLGDTITDQLNLGGSGQIVMDLNPSAEFTQLKAALVQ